MSRLQSTGDHHRTPGAHCMLQMMCRGRRFRVRCHHCLSLEGFTAILVPRDSIECVAPPDVVDAACLRVGLQRPAIAARRLAAASCAGGRAAHLDRAPSPRAAPRDGWARCSVRPDAGVSAAYLQTASGDAERWTSPGTRRRRVVRRPAPRSPATTRRRRRPSRRSSRGRHVCRARAQSARRPCHSTSCQLAVRRRRYAGPHDLQARHPEWHPSSLLLSLLGALFHSARQVIKIRIRPSRSGQQAHPGDQPLTRLVSARAARVRPSRRSCPRSRSHHRVGHQT